jgi:glycosyltransferase involved in cell wall biosynthesis
MDWLIIEDSLESREGHWFEYLAGFHRDLPRLGDKTRWLVSQNAGPDMLRHFDALPVLPPSICKKMSDGAPAWRRYARIPVHAWKTFSAVRRLLAAEKISGCIFVPTITVHHLLGWFWLVKRVLHRQDVRVLLFFPGLPVRGRDGAAVLDGSPTAKLMRRLLQGLAAEIRAGKVVLGVETEAMRRAAEHVFGVPFKYFPHPVTPLPQPAAANDRPADAASISLAGYGLARHEKGADIFVAAIEQYLARFPESRAKFVIQWLDDFASPDGKLVRIPDPLRQHPRVEVIRRLFGEGEYARRLAATNALVLPYRRSSYDLRVSRVVIEALVNGIPAVVTRGTTLAEQTQQFGVAVLCENDDTQSLTAAIATMEQDYDRLAARARERQPEAARHFSVENFRRILMAD